VDDTADIAVLVTRVLEEAEFDVVTASGGVAALAALKEDRPDAVVLDVHMPELTGWDVLARIRADPALHDLPVVMCTVRASDEDRGRAAELGADLYVTKPFALSDLVESVRRAVGTSRGEGVRGEEETGSPDQTGSAS
jgi:chemosensory pili system protein ChpA (sensor histidine kinase/response regulator)